jgi:hypothetical protein
MKFLFLRTSLPKPGYYYDPKKHMKFEHITKDQIKKASFVDKPVMMEHKVPIGKTFAEWEMKDGTKIGWSYIEDDNPIARLAIEEIKRNLIKRVSPGYNVSIYHDPLQIHAIEKEWNEISVTSSPDFDGEGGPEIIYGAYENELNIKLFEHINNLTDNLVYPAPADTQSQMQNPPLQTPQVAPQTQPQAAPQPQAVPQPQAPQTQPPPKADPKAIAKILRENPDSIKKLMPEELEVLLKDFSNIIDSAQTPVPPTVQAPVPTAQTPVPTHAPNTLDPNIQRFQDNAKDILKNRFEALFSAYDQNVKFFDNNPTAPGINPVKGREILNSWAQEVMKDPLGPHSAPAMQAIDVLQTQMVHSNSLLFGAQQNNAARQQVKEVESNIGANQIRNLMGFQQPQSQPQSNYGPMRTQNQPQPSYSPYPQQPQQPQQPRPEEKVGLGNVNDAFYNEVTSKVLNRLTNGGYSHPGVVHSYVPGDERYSRIKENQ